MCAEGLLKFGLSVFGRVPVPFRGGRWDLEFWYVRVPVGEVFVVRVDRPWVLEVSGVRVSEMGLLAGPGLGCFPVLCFIPVGRLTEAVRCSAFPVPPVSLLVLR